VFWLRGGREGGRALRATFIVLFSHLFHVFSKRFILFFVCFLVQIKCSRGSNTIKLQIGPNPNDEMPTFHTSPCKEGGLIYIYLLLCKMHGQQ
jgi:hypothetical protein